MTEKYAAQNNTPIDWKLEEQLFKGMYALTCDSQYPISMKLPEHTFQAMKEAMRRQADQDTVTIKRSELEELKRLANNVCLQRLNGTIIDEGSSIFELSAFLKESALGKGE